MAPGRRRTPDEPVEAGHEVPRPDRAKPVATATRARRRTPHPTLLGRATVYTVAQHAGVSVATVSRVLASPDRVRPDTRDKVLRAVDDLDYVPHAAAKSLASRQHEAHGLVLPELGGPYYSELLMGYEAVAAASGMAVLLLLTEGKVDLDVPLRRLASKVDGIALMGAVPVASRTLSALRRKVPVIGLTGHPDDDLETFATSNQESAQELTTHLIAEHGRTVQFVGTPALAPDVQERYDGFLAAHEAAGRQSPPQPLEAGLREVDGHAVADRLLVGEVGANALFCANDELALSIMQRLQSAGVRVPDDIAIVGWDDVMTSRYVQPALTTVAQPVRELGSRAASRMGELIGGHPATATQHDLPTTVVIRQSCGCPGANR